MNIVFKAKSQLIVSQSSKYSCCVFMCVLPSLLLLSEKLRSIKPIDPEKWRPREVSCLIRVRDMLSSPSSLLSFGIQIKTAYSHYVSLILENEDACGRGHNHINSFCKPMNHPLDSIRVLHLKSWTIVSGTK